MARNRKQEGLESLFRGKAKELSAAALFTNWLWTTARPEPDIGADLLVEIPAQGDTAGATFAIQSRSHNRNVRTETIERASALRLQGSVLPAFVLSIHNGTGHVRWICIEALFENEPTFLNGGDLKVRLVDEQTFLLSDPAPPAEFVAAVYRAKVRSAVKATPSLKLHAQATEEKYRDIDPSFIVRPSFHNGTEVLTIGARDSPVTMQVQMELRTPQHRESVREAFEWGSAAHVQNSTFCISGARLFEHIQKDKTITEMRFVPKPLWEGSGVLSYNDAANQSRTEVVDVRISTGTKGIQLTTTAFHELMTFTLRMDSAETGNARMNVTFALIRQWSGDELKRVVPALRLLEAAVKGRQFVLSVETPDAVEPLEFRWSTDATSELDDALLLFQSAVALLRLAKERDWDLPPLPMQEVSPTQSRTIVAAEALSRGEHVNLPPTTFSFNCSTHPGFDETTMSALTVVHGHELPVHVGGQLLGTLPAWVMLRNFDWALEPIVGSEEWTVRCTPREDSTHEYFPPDQDMPKP